eukprot:16442434-Heterocapsa_arctica.AAC.1
MSHVRRAKDLLLLVCTISVVFPQFGTNRLLSLPEESIVDLISRYDLETIARYDSAAFNGKADRVHNFAMPCSTMIPTVSEVATPDPGPAPFRRKPRFDDNVFIEEVVTNTPFKDYSYAIKNIKLRLLGL